MSCQEKPTMSSPSPCLNLTYPLDCLQSYSSVIPALVGERLPDPSRGPHIPLTLYQSILETPVAVTALRTSLALGHKDHRTSGLGQPRGQGAAQSGASPRSLPGMAIAGLPGCHSGASAGPCRSFPRLSRALCHSQLAPCL